MALSTEQVQLFLSQGFVVCESFFSEREAAALAMELARIYDERRTAGTLRNVAIQDDGTENDIVGERLNLQVIPLYDKSALYRALPFQPAVLEAVEQLIGGNFRLHLDQSFWKPAKRGTGTLWHQDNAYFKIDDPLRGTAMWIAIHDATVDSGTLHVIPGSHKEEYEHYRDPLSDHHITCDPPEERAAPVVMPAGGVVFFCYGICHGTKANLSDRDRAGVALHFIDVDLGDVRDGTYPILRGPEATGGVREFGERVEGTWEACVERALRGKGAPDQEH